MIELRHLKKSYATITPLKDINATINDGDVISVIGPSGCGKSTLLRMINLLEKPTEGRIFADGIEITATGYPVYEARRKIGMVFQSFNLFGHLTVIENVMLPRMDLLKKPRAEAYSTAMNLLHSVGMDSKALDYPNTLSGGQKQRVAIARTLAMDPEVILFDEPTSALDPTMVGEVQSVIKDLAGSGRTMMIVTHEMKFAREICSRVFYLDEGIIYEEGSPEQIFDNPQRPNTRRLIHQLKIFETFIEDASYDFRGAISSLNQYGQKNRLENKCIYSLQAVFEELCQQIIPGNSPNCRIHFVIEYSERLQNAAVTAEYGGVAFNPKDSNNELSLSILNNVVSDMNYSYSADAEYKNKVTMNVKTA